MPYMERKRIAYLDALKGFVILCVVFGHVIDGYISSNIWPEYNSILTGIFRVIYSFHMPICFIISGFLFQLAYVDQNGSARKRKIYTHAVDFAVVYVIFCVLLWAFKLIFSGSVNSEVGFTDILFIWAKPMPSYWYLYVLIALYLIFSLDRIRRVNPKLLLCVLLGVSVIGSFLPGSLWFQIPRIAYYAFFFYCGILRCQKSDSKLWKSPAGSVISAAAVIICAILVANNIEVNEMPVVNIFVAAGLSGLLWRMFERLDRVGSSAAVPVLNTLGKNMLEIYVMHCFVAAAVRIILPRLGITNIAVSLMLNFAVSVLAPVICSYVLKYIKLHGYIFRLFSTVRSRR